MNLTNEQMEKYSNMKIYDLLELAKTDNEAREVANVFGLRIVGEILRIGIENFVETLKIGIKS